MSLISSDNVAVIIPAFNEGETIGQVVKTTKRSFPNVFVVDDGSADATVQIAVSEGATVIECLKNFGYDHALFTGLVAAKPAGHRLLISLDADGQHPPEVLKLVESRFRETDAPLIIGVRSEQSRFAEEIFGLYSLWRYRIPDLLCGVKGYHSDLIDLIEKEQFLGSIGTGIALAGLREGALFECVPVEIRQRASESRSRFGSGLGPNFRILRALGAAVWRDLSDVLLRRRLSRRDRSV